MIKRKDEQLHSICSDRQRFFDVKYPRKNPQLCLETIAVRPKNKTLNLTLGMLAFFVTILIIHQVVQAGSLSPSASPAATMYTLSDIYTRLTTNATSAEGGHVFVPSASPAGTLYTLTQVYGAIPTIDPVKVDTGTTYLGIVGTLLANLFNGSSGAGGQADGGSDDYNNGGAPFANRYAKGWTTCNAGNTYCGTSDAEADMKDDSTNLIWSFPCNGASCSSFSDASPLTYSWNSSGGNNGGRTAAQLCSDQTGWYLPHQKQLLQAYVDGSYNNLEAAGTNRNYWSGTVLSSDNTYAWPISLSQGTATSALKTAANYIRCVRPGS